MTSILLPHGLATTIGSLPHRDPAEAAEFVLATTPRLPAAPSLPARSPLESMLGQAAWGIRGVVVAADGSLQVDEAATDLDDPMGEPGVDGEPFVGLRAFLAAISGRVEPVKLQLTGPLTLGLALAAAGMSVPRAFALAAAAVRERAVSLVAAAGRSAPKAQVVVFVDEPGLTAAMQPGFPLDPVATVDVVSGALAALEPMAVTGLHCCGAADWTMALAAGPQILSLPLGAGALLHASGLAAHLDRGGWIAWGAVPTHGPVSTRPEPLWRTLSSEWCDMVRAGCDPVALRRNAMITPVCGLARHGLAQAEGVLALCADLARRLETQALGVRLTIGA